MGGILWAALAGAAEPAPTAVNLTHLPLALMDVAQESVDKATDTIPVDGPWRFVGSTQGIRSYQAKLPIRPRALFFDAAPEGMDLRRGASAFRYANMPDDADSAGTWAFSADTVTVRLRQGAPRPQPGDFVLRYKGAREREDALHRVLWRSTTAEFVVRSMQVDDVTRRGVYLPAPALVGWDVTVPEGGRFGALVGIVPPEVANGRESDGTDAVLAIGDEVVATWRAEPGGWTNVEADLSRWSGETVRLTLQSRDEDPTRDHLFFASPRIDVPVTKPKRLVLVFVDTLRRDHLGTYGYRRGTSPKVDEWAKGAMVFDQARTVAPWTLPSARALLTGQQPEEWESATTLQQRLGARGWATGAFVGNVYLSSNFDMAEGWDEHACVNWPSATLETSRALDWLERNRDRDAMLLVHYMDLHLPYKEPKAYQHLYAGDPPPGLPSYFTRFLLLNAATRQRELVRRYIVDRYDQNIRYVDDEVSRLLAAVGDDAVVAFFSDHGEEFFDHGDLEHGHTLFDELIRIPLVVKAPGLGAGRTAAPTSLLDLAPTLLDLLGVPAEDLDGRSMVSVAKSGTVDGDRPLAFGRVLYGNEGWGVVKGATKYITRAGGERIHDLKADPGEATNLRIEGADPLPLRKALADALGRPLALAWRVTPRGKGSGMVKVELHVPGGIERAWVGDDPTRKSDATLDQPDDETIKVHFRSFRGMHREVYVIPRLPLEEATPQASLWLNGSVAPVFLRFKPYEGVTTLLGKIGSGARNAEVHWAVTPLPSGQAVSAFDPELLGALQAMGYMTDDREGDDAEDEAEAPPPPEE